VSVAGETAQLNCNQEFDRQSSQKKVERLAKQHSPGFVAESRDSAWGRCLGPF